MIMESGSDEEFDNFGCEGIQSSNTRARKKKDTDDHSDNNEDDDNDFKGVVKNSGRKRKAPVALESDDSDSDEDEGSSDDEDSDDTEDYDDDDDLDNDGKDDLDVDLNDDSDDIATNSDQCPICLMSLGGQKLGTPNDCQHVFCLACILEWSKNANTCPVDRKVFHEILVHSTKKGPILERIPVEDRRVPDVGWEQQPTFCEVCNQSDREDRMLLCDGCDNGYHLECLRPRLYTVPAGSWYCATCLEIRRNEEIEDNEDSVPEMLPGTIRRSRDTTRTLTRRESNVSSETDGSPRARTAATIRRRSSSARGRGRGRGRTTSRSSGRGRSRTTTARRSRTGSGTRGGRGGKKKTRKGRTTSSTGKTKRKKRKRTSTKKKHATKTPKAKKRKVDNEEDYRHPFGAQSFRGRTARERLSNSIRMSGSSSDAGRGLGISTALSVFGDNYALDGFEDESTNEAEQSDSSSFKSVKSDVLGSIFDDIETLHDENATVLRDGRVMPSESHDKHSVYKGSQIKPNEGSCNPISGSTSREGNDDIPTPRDNHGRESTGNQSCDTATLIPDDRHMEKCVLLHTSRDDGMTKFSRDPSASEKTEGKDKSSLNSKSDSEPRPLVENEFKETKTSGDCQMRLQSDVDIESNKLEENSKTSSTGHTGSTGYTEEYTGYTSDDTVENRSLTDNSESNYSRTAELHKASTTPTKMGAFTKYLPSRQGNTPSCSSSSSRKPLKQHLSPGYITLARFKIPKRNTILPESCNSKNSPSSGTFSTNSQPLDSFESKSSNSTRDADTQDSIATNPINKGSSRLKRVSPISWNNRECDSAKLPTPKETNSAVTKTNSSTAVVKANSPKTPNVFKPNESQTLNDKNIILKSESKSDFSISCDSKTSKSEQRLSERKADVVGFPRDNSHPYAFSPCSKIKSEVFQTSFGSSLVKQEGSKVNSTTEITTKSSCLEQQSPRFYSKPSLQQLPSSVKRSSLSSSKSFGTGPSSTGMNGSTSLSTGSLGKTEKRSHSSDGRFIEYSKEKGELKIRVGPRKEDIYPSLRGLHEESHPALRSLPEESHPNLRSLPLPSLNVDPSLPPTSAVQLNPLKSVAKNPPRPKLKMLSASETSQSASGTLVNGIQPSRDFSKRTNQNLAIIEMLRHKTSSLRAEVEKGHSLLREELEFNAKETPELPSDSLSRGGSPSLTNVQLPQKDSPNQQEISFNRPKLSSLNGMPRRSNLPVAVVRPCHSSVSYNTRHDLYFGPSVSFADSVASENLVPQAMESEREKNRRMGIARLQRIERVKNLVKGSLQPYYDHNEITREDCKEIFIRAVDKVKDSTREVDYHRIAALVKKYVKMFKGLRLIGINKDSDL